LRTYSFGHTNSGIADGKSLSLLVGDDVDAKVLARVKLGRVGQGFIANLVKGIRGIRDELAQEDFLVGVHRVDDEREELRNLSLELKRFARHDGGCDKTSERM
jgi:hypothetical protein